MGMTILPVGITGAYVVEAMGRDELLVVHVLPDSPAAGVLKIDDIIIGANGRLFVDPEDPRPEMGNALCESQSPELGGILTLQIVRDHKPMNVKMDLGSTLDFGPTWPYNYEKTRQVRAAALKYVMETPRGRYDFWTPLFLMASGDDEALEMARRTLCSGLKKSYEENTGGSAWTGGYRLDAAQRVLPADGRLGRASGDQLHGPGRFVGAVSQRELVARRGQGAERDRPGHGKRRLRRGQQRRARRADRAVPGPAVRRRAVLAHAFRGRSASSGRSAGRTSATGSARPTTAEPGEWTTA